ncbi:MAG: hypothetical protein RLZZ436_1168 [Planctomycetota bacterium]
MVLAAAIVLTGLVILASWGQMAWYSLRIASWYPLREPAQDVSARRWPKAAVLLPLRGADPQLIECLRGLCRQDYPDFQLRLVLDSADDEAWGAVRQAAAEFPQVSMHTEVLTERLETCSLKSSALLQAVRGLPPDVQIAAVVDADVIVPVWWLRELVRPFDDPQVVMSGGLRWFLPERTNCGSVIRRIWGAAASAQMYSLNIPWGGTLAYRADFVRDPALQRRWSETFVEDVSVAECCAARGQKLKLIPRLSMVNTETISLGACYRFMRRQIFSVRMYHPAWRRVMLTCLGLVLSCILTGLVSSFAVQQGAAWAAWMLWGLLLGLMVVTTAPLLYLEQCLHAAATKERPIPGLSVMQLPMIPATIVVYGAALLGAARMRRIDWRGICYQIGPRGRVRRLNDGPYRSAPDNGAASLL